MSSGATGTPGEGTTRKERGAIFGKGVGSHCVLPVRRDYRAGKANFHFFENNLKILVTIFSVKKRTAIRIKIYPIRINSPLTNRHFARYVIGEFEFLIIYTAPVQVFSGYLVSV